MTCKTCKTCKHWAPCAPTAHDAIPGGHCSSPKLMEDCGVHPNDALVYSYAEGGAFWTGPEFGCVHHVRVTPALQLVEPQSKGHA